MTYYKHKKTGKLYTILTLAHLESDKRECVVYTDSKAAMIWVRPLKEFCERFESLEFPDIPVGTCIMKLIASGAVPASEEYKIL